MNISSSAFIVKLIHQVSLHLEQTTGYVSRFRYGPSSTPQSVLRNRNYLLRFRFRLLTSYGSGSGSRAVSIP